MNAARTGGACGDHLARQVYRPALSRGRASASFRLVLAFVVCVVNSACASAEKRRAYQALVHGLTTRKQVDLDELAASTIASPHLPNYRESIVVKAIEEAKLGLWGRKARERYNGVGAWCTEFARWLYGHCGAYSDPALLDEFAKAFTSDELAELFARRGRWVEREQVTARTVEVGDYLPIDLNANGSPNHSTIVVYVSTDKKFVYTIDGNNDRGQAKSRVYLKVRPYMTADGNVHPMIAGVGKVWPPGRN